MKDFDEFLKQTESPSPSPSPSPPPQDIRVSTFKSYALKLIVPLCLTAITGPMTTISLFMQITDKPLIDPHRIKEKVAPNLKKEIENGLFGDRKLYYAATAKGYSNTIKLLVRDGLRGLFKGNFTGMLFSGLNSKIRAVLFEQANNGKWFRKLQNWEQQIATFAVCTIADTVTLPIMLAQSRLVLQNSASNFRTYKGAIDVLRHATIAQYFAGAWILLLKNALFVASWKTLIKESLVYSFILSTFLSHLAAYPFLTVLRQMQCNHIGQDMMHQRKESVWQVVKRNSTERGILGLYRGFLGYMVVHVFTGAIVVEAGLRSGMLEEEM